MLCIPTHGVLNRKLLVYTEKKRKARSGSGGREEQLKEREAKGRSREGVCVRATSRGGGDEI